MHHDPAGLILFLHTFFVRAGGLSELNQVDYKIFLNQEIGEKTRKMFIFIVKMRRAMSDIKGPRRSANFSSLNFLITRVRTPYLAYVRSSENTAKDSYEVETM